MRARTVGIIVGSLALATVGAGAASGVGPFSTLPAAVTVTDDDGTADQGSGDAPGTPGSAATLPTTGAVGSTDDDGTADQGSGDAPGTPGSDDAYDDHGGDRSGSDDDNDDSSGHGSDDDNDDSSGHGSDD